MPGGGGVSAVEGWGVCLGGVCPEWGVYHHAMGQTPPLPVNRITDRCKNITLPQTSFAGGKNVKKNFSLNGNVSVS